MGLNNETDGTPMDILSGGSKIEELDTSTSGDIINPSDRLEVDATPMDILPTNDKLFKVPSMDDPNDEGEAPSIEDTVVAEETIESDEEVEEEVVEDEVVDTKEDKEESGDTGFYNTIGKHLSDDGILSGYTEEMEDTPEALQSLVESSISDGIEKYKNQFKSPMAKDFLDYIEKGGDPGQFIQLVNGPDYTQFTDEAIEGSDALKKQLIKDYFIQQGDSPDEANEMVQAFEDAGQLDHRAKKARDIKLKEQEGKRKAELTRVADEAKTRKENLDTYLTSLKSNIESSEDIGGFKLTKKVKTDFYNYITKVDAKSGKTKLQLDASNEEKQMLMSFYYFQDFKLGKLEKVAKSKTTVSLQEKLGRYTDSANKQKSRKKTPVAGDGSGAMNLGPLKRAASRL